MPDREPESTPETTRPIAGVQGWLFERPPQDAQCESMKPTRRLGKGLAALVDLHSGTINTSAGPDDAAEENRAGESTDAPAAPVLHLLSSEPAGRPGGVHAVSPVIEAKVGAALEATIHGTSRETDVTQPTEAPVAVEPAPSERPVPATTPVPPAPAGETRGIVAEPAADPVVTQAGHATEAPADDEVVAPQPEQPAAVSEGFVDEWFDPPIGAFSPAASFQRVASAQPDQPAVTVPVSDPVPPPRSVAPQAAPAAQTIPAPPPAAPPATPPALDDPVLVDDGLFFDDVVVGGYLPDVDLDA